MASQPDPAGFAVAVAVGYAHILSSVADSLERCSKSNSPVPDKVVAVLLAVPVLMAYLLVVTLAFAVRVAADGYAHIVMSGGGGGDDGTLGHAAALSPAAVLGWFANMVVKLAVALVFFSGLAIALFHFLSLPCTPLVTQL